MSSVTVEYYKNSEISEAAALLYYLTTKYDLDIEANMNSGYTKKLSATESAQKE